ncbi:hypothetical protein AAG589_21040 [Isoptericola sp. F-RaC21]|uniref:hypothetical protein n=1 Tax=Isoptericola sp. F-RaC21 TaxID=3141452 RepID=UPI00315BA7D8
MSDTRRRGLVGTIAIATTLALCASYVPAAAALTAEDPADAAASLIDRVAPFEGEVVQPASTDGDLRIESGTTRTIVPADADDPLVMFTQGEGTDPDTQLEVPLPEEVTVESPTVADDGTVFYDGVEDSTDVAVQSLDDGSVRLQTIIPEGDGGTHRYTYDFGEDSRILQGEAGEIFVEQNGDIVAEVATPWAYDADGVAVPTNYIVDEHTIVQEISPSSDTAYPVVADPKFIKGYNGWFGGSFVAARFTISETIRIAAGGGAAGAIGTLIGMVPNPYAIAAGTVLKAIGATLVVWAGGARALNKCVELRYYYTAKKAYGLYYSGSTKGCR